MPLHDWNSFGVLLEILLTFHSELSLGMIYTFNFHKFKEVKHK
jgi:hypothetical protein